MKFIVTGSGGCVCTPKPLCQCPVCVEARTKGFPYARCGCGLYLEDIALLVDTPEDIAAALNNAGIKAVSSVLYSHWDPDHTMGMRIFEQLRLEWLDFYKGIKPQNPVTVYAQPGIMEDLSGLRSKFGPLMDYYERVMKLIERRTVEREIELDGIKITFVSVPGDKAVTVFVFESKGKKLVYAPCDCRPFPDEPVLHNADILVMGDTFIGDVLKDGNIIDEDHPLRKELHSFSDALHIQKELSAKRLVITHIEEAWGKSVNDYKKMELEYDNVNFAYDGMVIQL
ncbi:MAG: MBL fold metallo-hydrolase [Clostridiales bacterium]|nr:MBL fold metallo-hydrolase [Clostridiales bacterium]